MGFFDKFLDVMKLNDDEDDYYDDDEDVEEEPPKKSARSSAPSDEDEEEDRKPNIRITQKKSSSASSKVTPMRRAVKAPQSMEVCVFKPTSFEDARDIGETILAGQTLLLNMEGVDVGLAQRIIDFTSGACYALDGNLQKVSSYIFVVTPSNVPISGDIQDIVNAFDFSGIQTGF